MGIQWKDVGPASTSESSSAMRAPASSVWRYIAATMGLAFLVLSYNLDTIHKTVASQISSQPHLNKAFVRGSDGSRTTPTVVMPRRKHGKSDDESQRKPKQADINENDTQTTKKDINTNSAADEESTATQTKAYRGWAMMHTLKAGGNSVPDPVMAVSSAVLPLMGPLANNQ